MRTCRTWRALVGSFAALVVSASALGQTAPTAAPASYAVLSLVGDQFSVTTRQNEVGSRLDQNTRRSYSIDNAVLDDIALGAAENAISRAKPGVPVLRFSIRDQRLFALQDKLLVDSTDSRGLREALQKLAREHQATRLVIVTKWRDDAQFKLYEKTTGAGKISGLGFYVDTVERIRRLDNGEEAFGYLGPYAYVSVSLVDVATMTPIRSAQARESQMNLPVHSKGVVMAWDALTPEGKVEALERVLRRGVESATAAALAD